MHVTAFASTLQAIPQGTHSEAPVSPNIRLRADLSAVQILWWVFAQRVSFILKPDHCADKRTDPMPREMMTPSVWLLCRAAYGKRIRCTGWHCLVDFIMSVIKNTQHEQNTHHWTVFIWKDFLSENLAVHRIINLVQQHFIIGVLI